MDSIATFKRLIQTIESDEKVDSITVIKLSELFHHLSPQAPVRSQRDLESCTIKADQLLGAIFDKVDCSDETLLCQLLEMLLSYGYFRLAQITYYIPPQNSEPNLLYMPLTVKTKWYNLEPLLPEPANLKWKGIINHCLVKDGNPQLLNVCLRLLKQKLHYYNIISCLSQHQASLSTIKRNGEKVCEEIVKFLMSVAFDDATMTGIDKSLFDLLVPFANHEQQKEIVQAIVRDLFKPQILQVRVSDVYTDGLYEIISKSIMNDNCLQEIFFTCMFDYLKCNLTRRKRRHCSESSKENGGLSIESILSEIDSVEPMDLIEKCKNVKISSKELQKSFLVFWSDTCMKVLCQSTTIVTNASQELILICSILLITTSELLSNDVIAKLTTISAKAIDGTSRSRLDKIFNRTDPLFLTELTKALAERHGNILTDFESPTQALYKSYIANFLQCCVLKGAKYECEKFNSFIGLICDKTTTIPRHAAHLLQYVCIRELANTIEVFSSRISTKVSTSFQSWSGQCCKGLFKFIKRNSPWKTMVTYANSQQSDTDDLDTSQESNGKSSFSKHLVAADALICSLRLATERKDLETLDAYSDLLLKLFENFLIRVRSLIDVVENAQVDTNSHLDSYLPKLLKLYIKHKIVLKGYLQYDLIESLTEIIIVKLEIKPNGKGSTNGKGSKQPLDRKDAYNQIKSKLDSIETQSQNNRNTYQTIINQQFGSSTEAAIGAQGDIEREKPCGQDYSTQSKALSELVKTIAHETTSENYTNIMERIIKLLEICNPLDHVLVLYLLLMLKSMCPDPISANFNKPSNDNTKFEAYKAHLASISCNLVRLAKSVEMGPSVHAFTKSGCHLSNRSIQCCTYYNCLTLYTMIFSKFPPKITNQLTTDAMQTCVSSKLIQYAKHSVQYHRFFTLLASAQAQLLKSICIGRKEGDILKTAMPIYLPVLTNLIRCLILSSDLQKIDKIAINGLVKPGDQELPKSTGLDYENELELLALDVGRLMNNLSLLRVKMVDFAPHLISSYIKDVQRASCPDSVRLHLNEGMFRIFDLVYAHQKERQESTIEDNFQRKTIAGRASGSLFEMIHARLDQASREILRDMHNNYDKFYRYTGKC